MQFLFYEEFLTKRVKKIINIFGEDWFAHKNILELGAAHGDVGIQFLKLGSNVLFSDVRVNHLLSLPDRLHFYPDVIEIDNNKPYNLNKRFDLVIHMGLLYHVCNWKQDLECALNHSNLMILDTLVSVEKNADYIESVPNYLECNYNGVQENRPVFSQEAVEKHLSELGCKFIRFDNRELNTNWSSEGKVAKTRHVYDWTYESAKAIKMQEHDFMEKNLGFNVGTWFRRFWLVIK